MRSYLLALLFVLGLPLGLVAQAPLLADQVTIELSTDSQSFVRYEPILVRYRAIYTGTPAEWEKTRAKGVIVEPKVLFVAGPTEPLEASPIHWAFPDQYNYLWNSAHTDKLPPEVRSKEPLAAALYPGQSCDFLVWLYPNKFVGLTGGPFKKAGDWELWLGCEDWQQPSFCYQSAHWRIRIKEPGGQDAEALAFARTPEMLIAFMGGRGMGYLKEGEGKALYGRDIKQMGDWTLIMQDFVTKFPNSAYHPFALFNLCQWYFEGRAMTNVEWCKSGHVPCVHEPDYELLLAATDQFLKKYPDHNLADEVHFMRFIALTGQKKAKEAEAESRFIQEKYPKSLMVYGVKDCTEFFKTRELHRETYAITPVEPKQVMSVESLKRLYYSRWMPN